MKYLQILPSFRGIERLMQRETARLARAIDQSMAQGTNDSLINAFRNVDTDRIAQSARTAGQAWASNYEKTVTKNLRDFSKSVPEFDPHASIDTFDGKLHQLKKDLDDIGKAKISPGPDQSDLSALVGRLRQLSTTVHDLRTNAPAGREGGLLNLSRDLRDMSNVVDSMHRFGQAGGRQFGGAFAEEVQRSWTKTMRSLPEILPRIDNSHAEAGIIALRAELKSLGERTIGIDIDPHDAYAALKGIETRLGRLHQEVDQLGNDPVNMQIKFDLEAAQKNTRDTLKALDPVMQDQGVQAGGVFAGAFDQRFHERISQALQAIPDVPIHADPGDAERSIAEIRAELETLSSRRIGVNIDADAAFAELNRLRARLAELDHDDVSIDVRTNALVAAAQLAAVSAEARRADNSVGSIAGEAGITISRLGYLVAIGASLGSLVAPAAAAASVAVAGVGTAALSAVAGFGVLALALGGVITAVKAIDNYTHDANKAAKSFSQSQNQMITATEGVRDAERNLQNTRQDAADAAVQAQQRIADAERNVGKARRDAADAVKQAREQEKNSVQDLARARQDAADAITQATGQERDAERSVTDAVRDQKKARQELSDALKEAAKDLRDLRLDVKQNAIDIDQATTAAMKAKEELDKVMSNPRATEIERRQALETFQEKQLQIEQLKNKQSDLAEAQKKADKEGVEGTDKVKRAREQVAAADDRAAQAARKLEAARRDVDKARVDGARRVADAEKRVSDAQAATSKAQRDGAERVAEAQRQVADAQRAAAKQQSDAQRQILAGTEAVTKAQRGLQQASVNAGVAGGDAFDTMNDALNHLSPAGQAFAKWLYGLKPAFDQLQRTAQNGLLPGLQAGIQTLISTYLPAFDRFVSKIATGLGNMFRATGQIFTDPTWHAFFSFIDAEALPSLQGMWAMAINVAHGIANITRALEPLAKPMGAGLLHLTEKFSLWSDRLQSDNGFQQFIVYAREEGPKVVKLIGDMVEFIGRLVAAAAPLGAVILNIVDGVISWVNSWDIGTLSGVLDVVAALGTAIVILTGIVRTVRFVTEVWNAITIIVARSQQFLTAAVARYNTAAATAVTNTGFLNGRLFAARGAGEAGAAGMAAMTGAAGPLGVALLIIGAAWLLFAQRTNNAQQDTDELTGALQELGKAYDDAGGSANLGGAAVEESFRKIVAQNEDLQKTVVTLSQLGIGLDQIAAAAGGSADDLNRALNTVNDRIKAIQDTINNKDLKKDVSFVDQKKLTEEQQHLEAIRDKLQEAADKASVASTAMGILANVTSQANTAAALLSPVEQSLADAQKVLADASATAQEKMDALTKAQDAVRQSTIDSIDADEAFNSGLITLNDTVKAAKDAHDKQAVSLAINTSQGLRNRDMIEALVTSADKMYDSDVALNGVTVEAVKKGNDHYNQIRKVAGQLGLNKTQTDALIKSYGKIPPSVETAIGFRAGDFDKMFSQLEMTAFIQKGLREGKDINTVKAEYKAMKSDQNRAAAHGWATGGPIAGPGITGGPTEDANLIWASKGEWMQPAAAVDYYGTGVMEAMRRRAIPKEAFPGYAAGGSILGSRQKWPFRVDLSKTWIPDDNWLLANTPGMGDGSFHGLSADASVAKLQKFALAQRGKTYLWAAVGPNRYDCSGLVGNLWALATGHSLYHRYMSTSDMGPGRHGMVSGPGKKMTVYLGPGHTAANVAGLHVEAYGGNGTPLAVGRIGTRLSYYNQKLHLPGFAAGGPISASMLGSKQDRIMSFLRVGWPEPPRGVDLTDLLQKALAGGTFDTGGFLPPGVSTVFNGTGRPEAVLTAAQWNAINAIAQGQTGAGNTYQFEFRDTTLDAGKLRAIQDREAVLNRAGRAR